MSLRGENKFQGKPWVGKCNHSKNIFRLERRVKSIDLVIYKYRC